MHYPHEHHMEASVKIGKEIMKLCQVGGTDNVIFMGDTNSDEETEKLMEYLKVPARNLKVLPLRKTCCADKKVDKKSYITSMYEPPGHLPLIFQYFADRIWSNFGAEIKYIDDPNYMRDTRNLMAVPVEVRGALNPDTVYTAAWHHPVMARITLQGGAAGGTVKRHIEHMEIKIAANTPIAQPVPTGPRASIQITLQSLDNQRRPTQPPSSR